MSYTVNKFEVIYKGASLPVAVHIVTDRDETNYIVSMDDYENFEIRKNAAQQWQADEGSGVTEELLQAVLSNYKQQ